MQKPIQTIGLLALLLVLGILFFWWPKYQDLADQLSRVKEKRAELESKEEYFSELEKISTKAAQYQSEISKIESVLPSTQRASDLLSFIGKTASQSGLILQSLNLGNVSLSEADSDIKETPLSMTIIGSYPAFKNFIIAIEKSARLVEVEQASFSIPQAGGEIFSFDLKIRTHSY